MSGLPPLKGPGPGAAGRPGHTGMGLQSSDQRAYEAEKQARSRIATAEEQAEEAERIARGRIDDIRDEYVRQSEVESVRQEAQVEAEKSKGYQSIREMQRKQAAELSRVRRDGETELEKTKNFYRDTLYAENKRGNDNLDESRSNAQRMLAYEKNNATAELENSRTEHQIRMGELREKSERDYAELRDQAGSRYETYKAETEEASRKAEDHFRDRYQNQVKAQEDTLNEMASRTSQKVNEVRRDSAARLDAYSERQEDPFYKLVDVDARIRETEDAYVLMARVPDHERGHVSVSVRGNEVVISGYRRNEEKLEPEPGHKQSTASFQSFSESFPISWPVEAKKLERWFEGDNVVVRIPKKPAYAKVDLYKAKPERAKAERPKFPGNLPNVEERKKALAESDGDAAKPESERERASRAGRTLG